MRTWAEAIWQNRHGETRGVWILLGVLGAIVTVLYVIVALIAVPIDRAACRQTGAQAGLAVRYEFPAGCFIRVDDQWVPEDRWIHNTGK